MKAIYEYPHKAFLVADIIHLTIGSSADIVLVHEIEDQEPDIMYDGSIQDLAFTDEGFASELCNLGVKYMTTDASGKIILYV